MHLKLQHATFHCVFSTTHSTQGIILPVPTNGVKVQGEDATSNRIIEIGRQNE
jgi:hypothetical protein